MSAMLPLQFQHVHVGLDFFDRKVPPAEGTRVLLSTGTTAALFSVPEHVSLSNSSGKLK